MNAWSEGEEHMAKLSVNAMIGLWARSTEVVYSVRSSRTARGADFSQAFAYEGGMVWDFVCARYRPIHDAVLGLSTAWWPKPGPAHPGRAAALPCAGEDGLPADAAAAEALHGAAAGAGGAATRTPLLGQQQGAAHGGGAPQTTEVERGGRPCEPLPGGQLPAAHGPAGHRKDAPGPDEAVHLVSKTHCSAQNLGVGAQTADHWVRYVCGAVRKLDWLVVEEITQLDMALWADLAWWG